MQPLHDLVQLLMGIAGSDQQAVCHTIFLEPGRFPGEHDACLPGFCVGLGILVVSKGYGVKPLAVQKPAQAAEIRIQ